MDVDLKDLQISRTDDASRGGWSGVIKFLVIVLVLGGAGLAVWKVLLPRLETSDQLEVRVATVKLEDPRADRHEAAFSAAGWVKLPRHHPVYVTPLIEGRVEQILVIEGDPVGDKQVIARLYAKDYEAEHGATVAAVAAAQASYDKVKAGYRVQEVAEARAGLQRLEAELATAKEILEHSRELLPGGAIPLEEFQKDELLVKTLEADIARSRQRLELLEEGFRDEEIALAAATLEKAKAERDLARQRLDYVTIRSPMKGVVLERLASQGQWLQPRDGAIVSIYDPLDLEARVDINQDDLGKIFEGQRVEITTRAEPERLYDGTVYLIEPKADLVKNTVPVRVKLTARPDGLLFPDMVVRARFLTKQDEEAPEAPAGEGPVKPVLTIPESAVLRDGDAVYVYTVESGAARQRTVVLGHRLGRRIVVTSGLRSGERVILSPPPGVSDGTVVTVSKGE